MKQDHFRRGTGPTAIDVEKLEVAFGEISARQDGTVITHDRVSAVLGIEYGTKRYYQIMKAWKRALLADGIVLRAVIDGDSDRGYAAITDAQKVGAATDTIRVAKRRLGTGQRIVWATRRELLGETEQRAHDHVSVQLADLRRRCQTATRATTVILTPTLTPLLGSKELDA